MHTIHIFQVGDWVRAHDIMVDNIDIEGFVVDNAHPKYLIIYPPKTGCVIALPYLRYDFVPMDVVPNEEDINAMIDIALAVKDREWFEELSKKLERYTPTKGG